MSAAKLRAVKAKRELDETEAAFDAVREAMVSALLATPAMAQAERERLYMGVSALDAVRAALRNVIENGALEEAAEEIRQALHVAA